MLVKRTGLHLAIDLDDCVLDFVGGVRQAIKKEYGVELRDEDITDFNLRPFLDPIIGRSWWAWMRDRSWIWSHFDAVDGAIGTLDRLRRDGHYLELVTSKPEWAEANVYRWLGKWRPPFQRVTIVGPEDFKVDFTDADLLVDDKLENIMEFSRAMRRALLFTRPHNSRAMLPQGAVRVDGWPEVYSEIRRISNV